MVQFIQKYLEEWFLAERVVHIGNLVAPEEQVQQQLPRPSGSFFAQERLQDGMKWFY
jgi:hypothetical protein